jgi:GH25 family lysozyme M1 (1,4-beta-N-acetylmuramidase)
MSIRGVDIYEGDGQVTWPKLAQWAQFAIVKVTEGDYHDSLASAERIQRAREAGVMVGGYCFLRPKPGRSGADEVKIFLDACRAIGLYDKSGHHAIRPVLDFEASAFDTSTTVGKFRTRAYLRGAIREVRRQLGGRHPIIYSGAWWLDDTVGLKWTSGCPLWVASYTHQPIIPTAWAKQGAMLWQYTDHQVVPGISRPVDANVYVGPGGEAGFRSHLCI